MTLRCTHTVSELEVSSAAYFEIRGLLEAAGYGHAIDQLTGLIDMSGIGLTIAPAPTPQTIPYPNPT